MSSRTKRGGRTARLMVCLGAFSVAHSSGVVAEEKSSRVIQLDEVVVTATRSEADVNEVTATVTRLGRKEMERRQPRDEADLFADEPDVAFARDMRRFGATRVNIRGIDDNRVVQMVDGVRMGDYYYGSGPTNFTMASALGTPVDFLKRVEVLRGPASSLYGSDALGGVVGYFTLDPLDLTGRERDKAFRVRAAYNGANNGKTLSALGAWRGESVDVLLGLTGTRADETENAGSVGGYSPARTLPNPANSRDQGVLAKFVLRPVVGHELKLGVEYRKQETELAVLRQSKELPRVSKMDGDDNAERQRFSLDWRNSNATPLYDRLTAKLFHQVSDTKNYNNQLRTGASAPFFFGGVSCSGTGVGGNTCYIEQSFLLKQSSYGINVQLDKGLQLGSVEHGLSYGLDLSRSRVEQSRDGRTWNLTTGASTTTLLGERNPARDFPIGETTSLGLFVQDDISLLGGQLTLTPGLRYDKRKLEPKLDELGAATAALLGKEVVSQSHSAWSPKIGALWKFNEVYSAWGQIVRGFRAPNYSEVNATFRNLNIGYATAPNPDLGAETSTGIELGLRWNAENLRGQFSIFDNNYKNFIETIQLNCTGGSADPRCVSGATAGTSISENLRKVNIHGAELRSSWTFAPQWRVAGALAYAVGTDETTGQPLNSVEPMRLSLSLAHDAGYWGMETRLRAASRKKRVSDWRGPTDPTVNRYFRTPGYAVVDLAAWMNVAKNVRVTAGVNNVFDRKYWLWGDIRQADARNPDGVDFYSQAGRHFVASVQLDF